MRKFRQILSLILFLFGAYPSYFSQVVQPFAIRYQTNQKGGITFVSNTALTCNPTATSQSTTCPTATSTNQNSITGSTDYNNNGWTMQYVDVDGDATTTMSSSDSLNLPSCSEISWAGLYWCASNTNGASSQPNGYTNRNQVKFKVNNGTYQSLTADQIINSTTGYQSYFCFKNVTSLVQGAGIKARFTLANMFCWTGAQNLAGGWTLVVVYKNTTLTDRNLTVFDGLAVVTSSNNVTVPISGFLTPLSGPVNFELGVTALDGDRGSTGDQLSFNGVGTNYLNVTDAMHATSNSFNSTICYNGVLTPFRLPNFNNTLGYDANIYLPNNSSLNYIGNSATSANIKLATSSDIVMTNVITSAIDIYQPDLRATVSYTDLNGGLVMANDILEYKIKCVNIGSDLAVNTYVLDTLDIRTDLVPGSLQVVYGPNSGIKTDALADDQGEYISASRVVKFRIGTGANGTTGGQVQNSPSGADSTIVKFRVKVINDCLLLKCDSTLTNLAYIYGTGNISGLQYSNNGTPNTYDANGCPTSANSGIVFHVSGCPPAAVTNSGPVCLGQNLQFFSPSSTYANYSWNGPNSFTSNIQNPTIYNTTAASSGNYNLLISFPGNSCTYNLSTNATIQPLPSVTPNILNVSCFNGSNGQISLIPGANSPYTYSWSNGSNTNPLSNLSAGNYSVNYTDANGCSNVSFYTVTQPSIFSVSTSVTSNYNGQAISCVGSSNGSATATVTGGVTPITYLWSTGATTASVSGLSAGTYVVTVTDANGCQVNSSVTISSPPPVLLSTSVTSNYNGQDISCNGSNNGSASVIVSGGVPSYSYLWSNGATTAAVNGLSSGTYNVVVTDLNNCNTSSSVTINQPPVITISTLNQNILCFGGSNGMIDATVVGGVAPYSYLWSNGSLVQDPMNLQVGSYTLSVTDANGCTGVNTTVLTGPSSALSITETHVNVLCIGQSTGSINITPTGGTAPYTYLWNTGQTSEDIFSIPAGTYNVLLSDVNGCQTSLQVSINQPLTGIVAPAVVSPVLCFGQSNGSINLTASGGASPYSYSWSNGSILEDLNNLPSGNYNVTITDNNGCIFSSAFFVTQPTAISISSVDQNVLCNGASTGQINVTVSGGVLPYSYQWSNGQIIEDISNLSAGTYGLLVTDGNGCLLNYSATISNLYPPIVSTEIHTNVSCYLGNTGSIDLSVVGGLSPYVYQWSNGQVTQDISQLTAGTYNVVITDINNCANSLSVNLSQPSSPILLTETHLDNSCSTGSTGSINLTVTGGVAPYSYLWNNGLITEDISNLASGAYTVQVTDALGCVSSISVTIVDPTNGINVASNVTNVLCFGNGTGSIDITVSGGNPSYSYSWNNGSNSEDISNLVSGTYSVTVSDQAGCQYFASFQVSQPTAPLNYTSNTQNVVCFGQNTGNIYMNVTGGTPPYIYSWSNGINTQNNLNLFAGTYSETITDANGCSVFYSSTISQAPSAINAFLQPTGVICFGTNTGSVDLTVSGGLAPYTYSWSNGSISEDISGVFSGNYSVSITDNLGCVLTLSTNVTQPTNSLSLSSNINNVTCTGFSNGSIDLTPSFGTPPYFYQWSNGPTSQDISNLFAGIYSITVTDANNCSSSLILQVTEPASPVSTLISVSNVICHNGASGSATASGVGGTAPYSFSWSNGQTGFFVDSLIAGIYSVSVTDNLGCITNQSFLITQPFPLSVQSTNTNNLCYGQSNGSITSSVSGGVGPYSYLWSTGATTSSIGFLQAGPYYLTITDDNGCTAYHSDTVTQPSSSMVLSVVTTNNICFGYANGSLNLSVTGGTSPYNYQWNTGALTEDIPNLLAGTYTATVIDQNGCLATQNYTVSQPPPISVTSVVSNVSCFGGSNGAIQLTVSGPNPPFTYNWTNGSFTEDIFNLSTGTYTNTITNSLGCLTTFSANITQPANPLSLLTLSSDALCYGQNSGSIDLIVSGGIAPYTYQWSNGSSTEDLQNLVFGNYSVIVTDANFCQDSITAQINQPALPISYSLVKTDVLCSGQSTGSLDLTVNGGTAPYVYQWSNGTTSQDINALAAGNYFVTVSDANGCQVLVSEQIVNLTTPLQVSLSGTNVSCFAGSNGTIDLTITGGVSPYQISWSNSATTEDLINLPASVYSVIVTDSLGCITSGSLAITQPTQPLSLSSSVQNIGCFGLSNGAIDLTINGGAAPYFYSWSNGFVSEDLSNVVSGTYSVIVYDANSCQSNLTAQITQPDTALSSTVVSNNILCFGQLNGSIDLTVGGGTPAYTIQWNNGQMTEDISNLSTGWYYVTITDANGCQVFDSAQITSVPSQLQISLFGSNVSCFGGFNGAVDLTISGGISPYQVTWSNGQITEDISNLTGGNYSVTVVDFNGCTVTGSMNINTPLQPLSIGASTLNVTCYGGSNGVIDLSVTGGTSPYSYLWSNGSTNQDLINVISGSYNVTVTDAEGCTILGSYSLTQPSSGITITSIVSNVSCYGGLNGVINCNVNGGIPPYSYSWSNGSTQEDLTGIGAGNYILTVTDASSCSATHSAIVGQPTSPLSLNSITTNVSCFGLSNGSLNITASGGTYGYTYLWSTGAITEDIQNLSIGNYTIQITDANSCQFDSTLVINQPLALSANSINLNVLCYGQSTGAINLSVSGGVMPYLYSWNNGTLTEDLINVQAGNYTVNVTDANGCGLTYTTAITQPLQPLTISETHQNVLCYGANNGSIDVSVTGGTQGYSYLWSTGSTSQDIANLIAGNYTIAVTDANNCITSLSIPIYQPAAPLIISSNITNVDCFGLSSGSIDVTLNGGTAPFTYYWNTGATSQDLYNVASGQYTLAVTDANNCVSSNIFNITQPLSSVNVTPTVTDVSCYGYIDGAASISVSGGVPPYAYLWTTSDTLNFIDSLTAGTYSVTVTDANGCVNILNLDVTQPAPLIPQFTYQVNGICAPVTVDFTNISQGSPSNCAWQFGNGQTLNDCGNFSYTYNLPGCYSVTLSTSLSNGCVSSVTMDSIVCVLQGPQAEFVVIPSNDVFYSGEVSFANSSVNADFYVWDFGDGSPLSTKEEPSHEYAVMTADTYIITLIATDSIGCVDTAVVSFKIDEDFIVYVPNAFTLDDDGINEVFIPVFSNRNEVKKYRIMIFNRWGDMIWETTDMSTGWDGRANGKDCQDDIYTWKLVLTRQNNEQQILVGHVSLLR